MDYQMESLDAAVNAAPNGGYIYFDLAYDRRPELTPMFVESPDSESALWRGTTVDAHDMAALDDYHRAIFDRYHGRPTVELIGDFFDELRRYRA